jgi:uncharacterized membrane protein
MMHQGHLWAFGYDAPDRAEEIRTRINEIRRNGHVLLVLDTAIVVRRSDGAVILDGEPLSTPHHGVRQGLSRFLAYFALAAPLFTEGAVQECLDAASMESSDDEVIRDEFIRDVAAHLKPATSVLFLLDECRDIDAIVHEIRGMGGTVLKTNVDFTRARLIQSALRGKVVDRRESIDTSKGDRP